MKKPRSTVARVTVAMGLFGAALDVMPLVAQGTAAAPQDPYYRVFGRSQLTRVK